ncbi:rhamnopyranosyl-N-acetylglucosaminyl-diphospho-decaprenol beta-1,3/1,4-galactofuranosyltransferase [Priestia megaterium]|uniref:glycosyltransferase n=1 Tax=Priestia megaterium TaxID=1404 RepID=UPI0039DFEB11
MKFISESSVDVVIVTYGNRWKYLEIILDRLSSFKEINKIVLVDNGVTYPLKDKLEDYDNIVMLRFDNNEGSAIGFHEGIKASLKESGDFIWLLDDDNLPEREAINKLRDVQKLLNNPKAVLSSFRSDRREMKAKGGQNFTRNSFFEFHIIDKIQKKQNRKISSIHEGLLRCESVPYGGLLLDKQIMKNIALPNKEYFLYCDDIDFTYQLTKNGYEIYCVLESVIVDLESSWYRKEEVPMFQGIFKTEELKRGFFSIRNRVQFEKKYITDSKIIYYMNILIYMCFVFLKYMPKNINGLKRYLFVIDAIQKGRKGVLGKDIRFL